MLLRSIIVEREPIYRQQETAHGFASGLFGVSVPHMPHLSDDRIGRALDRLFDADRTALLTELVLAVAQRFGVRFEEFHNDSTSICLCGSYRAATGRNIRGRSAPVVTFGYSKHHRPDLKQLLFILTMSADGSVPVEFRCADGNATIRVPISRPGTRCARWPDARTSSMSPIRSCAPTRTWITSPAPAGASSP